MDKQISMFHNILVSGNRMPIKKLKKIVDIVSKRVNTVTYVD